MKNVRIDTTGQLRCWHCGSTSFKEKRTFRSKMLVGVGALLTKKKLKCHACGEYNQSGNAKPYRGPASKRLGKKYGTLVNMAAGVDDFSDDEPDDTPDGGVIDPLDRLKQLGDLRDAGILTDAEFDAQKAALLGTKPPPPPPPPPPATDPAT
jgi:hypothetical protein